jgi:selenocysteine-specific elongation factor
LLDEMAATFVAPVPQVKAVLTLLAQRGEAVRIKDDFYLSPPAHGDLLARVNGWFDRKTEMAMADFRELTGGATRKWLIPLFEYLDRTGVTLRKGDLRIRRGKAAGAAAPAEGAAP